MIGFYFNACALSLLPLREKQPSGFGCGDFFGRRGFYPWSSAGEDGVDEDDELAGAGHDGEAVGLAGFTQALVEGLEIGVPFDGGLSAGEEGGARAGTAAFDMALALMLAGLLDEGG